MSSTTSKVIESYCAHCGLFIAAAPAQSVLEKVEQMHHCPGLSTSDITREQFDSLLREISARETDLSEWISRSEENKRWFITDPISAIRAAGLGIDERTLYQLELIADSIARKLRRC